MFLLQKRSVHLHRLCVVMDAEKVSEQCGESDEEISRDQRMVGVCLVLKGDQKCNNQRGVFGGK